MEKVISVLEILLPIAAAMALGVLARRRGILSPAGAQGLQDFAAKFGLPCLLFNSCYQSDFGPETAASMAMITPLMLLFSITGFALYRRGKAGRATFPLVLGTKEGGMLGVPLFLVLFGQEQVFRMIAMDVAQIVIAVPTVCIVASMATDRLSVGAIARRTFTSPLLLSALSGLVLNLTGIRALLDGAGVGGLVTETMSFLCSPVSAVILFCIGYTFSLEEIRRGGVLKTCLVFWGMFAVMCVVLELALLLVPGTPMETRWAVVLFTMLPPTFMMPTLGRTREETAYGSGVCSLCTLGTLVVFCVIAVLSA